MNTEIDLLVLGNYLIKKDDLEKSLLKIQTNKFLTC